MAARKSVAGGWTGGLAAQSRWGAGWGTRFGRFGSGRSSGKGGLQGILFVKPGRFGFAVLSAFLGEYGSGCLGQLLTVR